jgi:hypothetical protein
VLSHRGRAISDKDSARLKRRILENTAEIVRLDARNKETRRNREKSPVKRREFEQACAEFHERYAGLAFPGGYGGALERISSGDPEAMEAAICFLECRPYFFRSGYMFKTKAGLQMRPKKGNGLEVESSKPLYPN